jgi:hypothetical protein
MMGMALLSLAPGQGEGWLCCSPPPCTVSTAMSAFWRLTWPRQRQTMSQAGTDLPTSRGYRPALLGSGVSVVRWLANLRAHCETRNRAALAPSWVADVLVPAFKSQREAGTPPDCPGAADPDPSHDLRESTLGSAQDPGGARAARVQSFGENGRQVYASRSSSRAIFPLAVIPEAARVNCLGVRFLLRPNHHVFEHCTCSS